MSHKKWQRHKWLSYINTSKAQPTKATLSNSGFLSTFVCVVVVVLLLLFFFIFFLNMGGLQTQMFLQPCLVAVHKDFDFHQELEDHWTSKGGGDHYNVASSTSSFEDSSISNESQSSLDLADDACSSTSNSSSQSDGPLEDFTDLFAQLPIKRGLSMFYQGKSQSFTSLSSVKSIEDLPKKENSYSRRLNSCKSYAGGLDTHKSCYTLPKAPTFKKAARNSLSFVHVRRATTLAACRSPPSIPVYDESF